MRPLTKVQMLNNNDLELTCTICNQTETIPTALFNEVSRSSIMRRFNNAHAKAHEKEPEIENRIVKTSDLTKPH